MGRAGEGRKKTKIRRWSKLLSTANQEVAFFPKVRQHGSAWGLCEHTSGQFQSMARVLVIGVDHAGRLPLKNSLQCAGHTVSMAGSFAEGYENLGRSGGEVVLTNLHVPESEFLRSIAHLRSGFPHVKILAIAREHDTMDFLAVRMMGADDLLREPLAIETLLDAVQQVLREQDKS